MLLGRDGMPGRAEVGLDDAGRAFVVWDDQYADSSVVRARRWQPGLGWGAMVVVHGVGICLHAADAARAPLSCRGFPATRPSLAVDRAGSALVLWQQSDGVIAASFR